MLQVLPRAQYRHALFMVAELVGRETPPHERVEAVVGRADQEGGWKWRRNGGDCFYGGMPAAAVVERGAAGTNGSMVQLQTAAAAATDQAAAAARVEPAAGP